VRAAYLLTAALFASTAVGVAYLTLAPPRATPAPDTTAEPLPVAPAPPAPPCIHEVCMDRVAALQCVYVKTGQGTRSDVCMRFAVEYEHACTCDRWGPVAAPDGGAP